MGKGKEAEDLKYSLRPAMLNSIAYGWVREQPWICCPHCDSFFFRIDPSRLSSRNNTNCAVYK